jgi:hypothetical protein
MRADAFPARHISPAARLCFGLVLSDGFSATGQKQGHAAKTQQFQGESRMRKTVGNIPHFGMIAANMTAIRSLF